MQESRSSELEEVEGYCRACSGTCWAGVCISGHSEGSIEKPVFYRPLVGGSASRTVVGLPFTPKDFWKDHLATSDSNVPLIELAPKKTDVYPSLSFLPEHYPVQNKGKQYLKKSLGL